ncbi:type 2 periplasmic-binding domain-containing protein [Advenella kashmirensis]|nr:extracellular solute-binding protein [Advenella kashmirensis]
MSILRGMTWDHPRGYEPLQACSEIWQQHTGVQIEWDRRSLQDFESFSVQTLARSYDLIVIDHPHVGQVTHEKCLQPLDLPARYAELEGLKNSSVGASVDSYYWQNHQWALPIDAATQVQAWVPGRLTEPTQTWEEMMVLARLGQVLCPLRPPHSLMLLFSLMAHLGAPGCPEQPDLFDPAIASEAYNRILELSDHLPQVCWSMDPIAAFEQMSRVDSPVTCVPFIYGYVSYALEKFRPVRVAFSNIPVIDGREPSGTTLGGTGIAVSAFSRASAQATAFAYWVASAQVQRTVYAASGGQVGHAAAWEDESVNTPVLDFYRATRATLDGAWVRPRHSGYMDFQQKASDLLNECLQARRSASTLVFQLNALYAASLKGQSVK